MIKFLIGGSPCTRWSISQKKDREVTAEGIGWELFRNYVIAKEKFDPDFFLYENNKSAAQAIKNQIAEELQTTLQYINSALVSAQSRWRFYGHNFGEVPLPEDRGILLRDIVDAEGAKNEKAYTLKCFSQEVETEAKSEPERLGIIENKAKNPDFDSKQYRVYSQNGKATTLCGEGGGLGAKTGLYLLPTEEEDTRKPLYRVKDGRLQLHGEEFKTTYPDGYYIVRKLTVKEAARLQTLPDDYALTVSPAQAYRGYGNGWTAEVIIHLLSYALKGIPKDEEIVVLSMYDGIGTGRYCFDKLGYKNITYYAYEIDKYAMQTANSNYADIIQCGDAFQVREPSWKLPVARSAVKL